MATPVDVYVGSNGVLPATIQGAAVAVVDQDTSRIIDLSLTDSNGRAAFLLPGSVDGTSYEIRIFKLGVLFLNPKRIQVLEPVSPPDTNRFDVFGTVVPPEVSIDPRVCRCTGRFVGFSNDGLPGISVRVAARVGPVEQAPLVVDGNLVVLDALDLRTDQHGLLSVDLLRGGRYYVSVAGDDDNEWDILVPDRLSANLIDLMHPQPVSLSWGSQVLGGAVSLQAGSNLPVDVSVLFSDFEILTEGLSTWILLCSSDSSTVTATLFNDKVVLNALTPGQATITVSIPPGLLPSRIPGYTLTATPLVVTVTSTV